MYDTCNKLIMFFEAHDTQVASTSKIMNLLQSIPLPLLQQKCDIKGFNHPVTVIDICIEYKRYDILPMLFEKGYKLDDTIMYHNSVYISERKYLQLQEQKINDSIKKNNKLLDVEKHILCYL